MRRLNLRVRVVAGGGNREAVSLTVHCPARGCTATVHDCAACGQMAAVSCDLLGPRSYVMCEGTQDDAPGRPAGAAPTVGDVMTRRVLCVAPDLAVGALAALLVENDIGCAPVVDERGLPVGIVSKTHILRDERLPAPGVVAADIMSPLVSMVSEHAPLPEAAALMVAENARLAPVIDDDGEIVGMLAAIDVLRWLAGHDGLTAAGAANAPQ